MPIYVLVTQECENQAKEHNQSSALFRVKDNIEKSQNLAMFSHLSSSNFLKRSLSNSYRLIALQTEREEKTIIIFLYVFSRGSHLYQSFLENVSTNAHLVQRKIINEIEPDINKMLESLKQLSEKQDLPRPNLEERKWLYEVLLKDNKVIFKDEIMILESSEWIKEIKKPDIYEHVKDFHKLLLNNIDRLEVSKDNADVKILQHKDTYGCYKIYYVYRPDLKKLLLVFPIVNRTDIYGVPEAVLRISKLQSEENESSALYKIGFRSYPLLILADFDLWKDIQKDEEANLALSPEEAELLNSVIELDKNYSGFPLFINGRAGSGKSTMLQYLAAEYVYFGLKNGRSEKILYMTYTKDLLHRARSVVKALISLNYEKVISDKIPDNELHQALDRSFVIFGDFLYSLLDDKDKIRFQLDKYVNYSKFKVMWEKQFSKRSESRGISVEIAWHALRTYIKGMRASYEDDFGPQEFERLPKKRKSISQMMFNNIYNIVWLGWYKKLCTEEGYWDDQDIATWVFEKGLADDVNCVAIFCDEAQDFTTIELSVILQMCLFSKRKLFPDELRRVPIAFAGDPLQTINPTGFSWEAIKDEFHNVFSQILDPNRTNKLTINFVDLTYNYRSNSGIVRFCNTIQLLRCHYLNHKDIRPQQAWWLDDPVAIGIFSEDSQIIERIKNRPELVILLNCELGEEYEFVNNDPILSELKKERELEQVYQNVFSPMRAKGLEFQEVVLYKFGQYFKNTEKLLAGSIDIDSPEEKLIFEYFFNRLYVAASRAKQQLCIVDSREAVEKFWRCLFKRVNEIVLEVPNLEIWKDKLCLALTSEKKWWERESISLVELAKYYEAEGIKKQESYLLRQAALFYEQCLLKKKALECAAEADYIDGNYLKAGEAFYKLNNLSRVFDSFWKACSWDKLFELSRKDVSLHARNEALAAKLMITDFDEIIPDEVEKILNLFEDKAHRLKLLSDPSWKHFMIQFSEKLRAMIKRNNINWHKVFSVYHLLYERGLQVRPEVMGLFAFSSGEFEEAVKYFETSSDKNIREYWIAKANTSQFPENIYWYGLLEEYHKVVKIWQQNKNKTSNIAKFDESIITSVTKAFLEKEDYETAVEILMQKATQEALSKAYICCLKEADEKLILKCFRAAIKFFLKHHQYKELLDAIEQLNFPSLIKADSAQVTSEVSNILDYSSVLEIIGDECQKADQKDWDIIISELFRRSELVTMARLLKYYKNRPLLRELWDNHLTGSNKEFFQKLFEANITYYILDKRWDKIARFLESQDPRELLLDDFEPSQDSVINDIDKAELLHYCLILLAMYNLNTREKDYYIMKIGNLIRLHLLKSHKKDYGKLSLKVIGALIERFCTYSEAISFYQSVIEYVEDTKVKTFFSARLGKNYLKWSKYLANKDYDRSSSLREKGHEIFDKIGIKEDNVGEYPFLTLNDLKIEASERKPFTKIQKRGVKKDLFEKKFRFDYSREHMRIRIENRDKFQMCSLDLNIKEPERALRGDVDVMPVETTNSEIMAWSIPDWDIRLSIKRGDGVILLTLEDTAGNKIEKKFENYHGSSNLTVY